MTKTAEHVTEVVKVTKEKETASTETTSATEVENTKALGEVVNAKTCAIQSVEESFKFKKIKITQRRTVITKTITKRRTIVTQWSFQLSIKRDASDRTCALAQKTKDGDKTRLDADCKRLSEESDQLAQQIQIETEKINSDEKDALDEIAKDESELEQKRTKETLEAEEKADQEKNEIDESKTEKELDLVEENE